MRLNVTLNEEQSKAFQDVKNHSSLISNKSIICLMISHEEDRILRASRRKVFLPNEIYDKAEKAAKALNLTIDEYVDSVTEQLLKKAANTPGQTIDEDIDEAAEELLKQKA